MNIQYDFPNRPMRVLVVNPTSDVGEIICVKICRGICFGLEQVIDLILLVYSNEMEQAEKLKYSLNQCGLPCNNSITITCDVPSLSDADLFLFITDFPSLNSLDFDKINDPVIFDSLYLLLKVASNLEWVPPEPEDDPMISIKARSKLLKEKPRKPVIVADGIIAMDILSTYTKNLPKDVFFCLTTIPAVSTKVLQDYLKVSRPELNRVYTWAANEDTLHVEVAKPILVKDKTKRKHCEWEDMSNSEKERLGFDPTQFTPTWLKKEYIDKVLSITRTHQHGILYKTVSLVYLLQDIWKTRREADPLQEWSTNCGVISDGSLNTIKGLPYVLPVIFKKGDVYVIDDYMKDDSHLKREINLINKAALEHHRKLIPCCNKFLETNVIQQLFIVKSSSLFDNIISPSTVSNDADVDADASTAPAGSHNQKTHNSEISKPSKLTSAPSESDLNMRERTNLLS